VALSGRSLRFLELATAASNCGFQDSAMGGGERMSKVDRAWWRMDSPTNLMMIVGFWILKPRVDYEAVCLRVEQRMLKYPRFRQRVVEDPAGATWVEDPDLDIHDHVVRERLPRVAKGRGESSPAGPCGPSGRSAA
jgi:hypothetical protein